jgi:hypothetical protein
MKSTPALIVCLSCLTLAGAGPALAQSPSVIGTAPALGAAAGPPAPPYSLPWQLRSVAPVTALRSDTSFAFFQNAAGDSGATVASMLSLSYKLTPTLAPLVRVAFVQNDEPGPAIGSAGSLVNPLLGLTYARKLGAALRGAAFGGVTLPVGMGGAKAMGSDATAAATWRGIAARCGMDNAMFAVNYTTLIGGLDLAWVAHKVTVQGEATVLQLFRTRNEAVAPESTRTNLTVGLHAGVFTWSFLSLSGELRHQRWLSTPIAVKANPAARDTTTVAIGPRLHVKAGNLWLRPGLSYATALDKPVKDLGYHIVQLDLPVVF